MKFPKCGVIRPLVQSGCRFQPRCPMARANCAVDEPALCEALPKHFVACHYAEDLLAQDVRHPLN